ncbi:uncharacterized protein [Halyomorpha halys]|uniref:uncharacterized protein n=1 Tax=Halyomorpha halys TaxID=286706 RepID=UPI0006D50B4C|nr:uncharacterized protein LOC106685817 [Halyomorpha halys]
MRTIVILFSLFIGVLGTTATNNATLGDLPAKERNRRLIPYMTYYLSQGQNQPYRAVMAVPYLAVPQYRQPIPPRYIQQPSSLTRMITQNYLTMSKLGNQRPQPRFNPNYPQELKYYVPVQNSQDNAVQYQKFPATFQYLKPQIAEQEAEYEHQQETPVEQYRKPSADEVIQFAKPEVQQYVTKYAEPILHYTKDSDYETGTQAQVPQYITKPVEQQYSIKEDDAPYLQKPSIQYVQKIPPGQVKLASHIAEYTSSKPLSGYKLQAAKDGQTTFTITQSQELEVDPMPTTPSPAAKYHATYVADPEQYNPYQSYYEDKVEDDEPEVIDRNINDILRGGVSLSKSLPDKITTENLDSSIKTLSKILRILQAAHSLPHSAKTIIKNFPNPNEVRVKDPHSRLSPVHVPKDDRGSTPGKPGVDYPAYDEIPETHFSCKDQRYKGFFGDPETRCQVWHYCDLNGGQASFLCPNGTIFSQVALTCDWWFNVKCASTAQLYVLNERLYKFILPQKPSFPEDYAGPLVDRYLTQKFKEIEEKNKNKTEEVSNNDEEFEPPYSIDLVSKNKVRSTG